MKRLVLPLLIGCFVLIESASAQLSHPHFVSLNFGTNVPLSEYKEADSLTSGSANTGLYYSFEAGAYFSKVFGVGISLGGFNNSSNDDDIQDQLKRDLTNSNGKFEVSSDNWSNGYIMIGPYLSFGSKKFIVDAKILAGVVNTEKPFISIKSGQDGTEIQSNNATNTGFGINYGLHFRIKLVGKLALRVNAEAIMSEQEFENKVQTTDVNGGTSTRDETIKKEVQALNLGAGLVINF